MIAIDYNRNLEDISGVTMFDGFKGELTIYQSALENLEPLSGIDSLFTIEIGQNRKLTSIRIWDVSGRFLMQDKFIRNWNFDLAFLSTGIYFVEIQVDGYKFANRILKI